MAGLSAILALFVCGVVVSHYALHNVSPEGRHATMTGFRTASYLAEGIIFIYVGMDALDPLKWQVGGWRVGWAGEVQLGWVGGGLGGCTWGGWAMDGRTGPTEVAGGWVAGWLGGWVALPGVGGRMDGRTRPTEVAGGWLAGFTWGGGRLQGGICHCRLHVGSVPGIVVDVCVGCWRRHMEQHDRV